MARRTAALIASVLCILGAGEEPSEIQPTSTSKRGDYNDHSIYSEEPIGPGKHFKELDIDSIQKFITSEKDSIVTFYGYSCRSCVNIHPHQEEAAGKVLRRSKNIQFGRIDVWRQGAANIFKKVPGFYPGATLDTFSPMAPEEEQDKYGIPRTFLIDGKNNSNIIKAPYDNMGHKSFRKFLQWIKNTTNYKSDFPPKKEKQEEEKKEL